MPSVAKPHSSGTILLGWPGRLNADLVRSGDRFRRVGLEAMTSLAPVLLLAASAAEGANTTELQRLKGVIEHLKRKEHQVEAEEENQRLTVVFGSFFATLLLILLLFVMLWMRNSHIRERSRLMSTIVQLNEERTKMMQKFMGATSAKSELDKPLL